MSGLECKANQVRLESLPCLPPPPPLCPPPPPPPLLHPLPRLLLRLTLALSQCTRNESSTHRLLPCLTLSTLLLHPSYLPKLPVVEVVHRRKTPNCATVKVKVSPLLPLSRLVVHLLIVIDYGTEDKNNGKLWEFIRDLLLDPVTNPSFIRWERREDGMFKFVQSDKVAKLWGQRKQNPRMTYEKLSRAMRLVSMI
jgi:hypothetical protein